MKEVAHWFTLGRDEFHEDIEDMTEGDAITIDGIFAKDLIEEARELVARIEVNEAIWPLRDYYLFYSWNSDSSIYHEIEETELGFRVNKKRHEGGHFPAFYSEVIIFRRD